CNGNWY
ncbi:hypothetical protein N499_0566B, partial [Wolbachia pipientis wVitA]